MNKFFLRTIPGLALFLNYPRDCWRQDLLAGLSVASVALPVGVAYAQLAGMSPIAGLYASILPMVAYALFGSSRQLIVGPDAATCAMVASTLLPMAAGLPELYISLSVALALITGLFCLLASRFKLGFLADFLSPPILAGFLNGVAISIALGQLGKLLGFTFQKHDFIGRILELPNRLPELHPATAIIGLGTLVFIQIIKRLLPKLPTSLIAMAVAALVIFSLNLQSAGIPVIGLLPAGLPTLHWPTIPRAHLGELLGAGAGLALISFSSAILTARSFAAKNRYEIDADREFTALGMANIAAAFSQGFVISGADSRTAVNDHAGGKTQMVSLVAAASIAIAIALFTAPLQYVPIAALAAVLITASFGLMSFANFIYFRQASRGEYGIAILTIIGVACVGVMQGMLFAVLMATLRLLIKLARPHESLLGVYPGKNSFHDLSHHPGAAPIDGMLVYRFDASLNFFNANYFRQRVLSLADGAGSHVSWVVLDTVPINQIDLAGIEAIIILQRDLKERGIALALSGRKSQTEFIATRHHKLDELHANFLIFSSLKQAYRAFRQQVLVQTQMTQTAAQLPLKWHAEENEAAQN
ncbi:SulP family inorganic anion transporter [Iodobacter fluviatilis]|uniref:SulP family inorganic anion transporter n=1 Tax=Iodobacter fluviatilis TaxID=537 RepID=UPI00165DE1C3|nr:SulP family inorganic anion transporter [Iodobacter fluviatilis]